MVDVKGMVPLMIGEMMEAQERKSRVQMLVSTGHSLEGVVQGVRFNSPKPEESEVRIVHYQPGTNIEKGATVVRVAEVISFRRNYG